MTFKPPEATKGDVAHTLVKAGLSALPMIGGPAVELFQSVIQPPLERRRGEWMQAVGVKLQELEDQQVISLEELGQNEQFVSAVLHASTIALRTHKDEKREALRNAVLNVALDQSPDEALQHMFFEWIDTFSILHIKMLRDSANPPRSSGFQQDVKLDTFTHNGGLEYAVENVVWKDLYTRDLVDSEQKGPYPKGTTLLGIEFLNFISEQQE